MQLSYDFFSLHMSCMQAAVNPYTIIIITPDVGEVVGALSFYIGVKISPYIGLGDPSPKTPLM